MELLGCGHHTIAQVLDVTNQVERELAVDAVKGQLPLYPQVCERSQHFENDVLVALTSLRRWVVPLVRLIEDVHLVQIGSLATSREHRLEEQAELGLRHVGWDQPLLGLPGCSVVRVFTRAWPNKLATGTPRSWQRLALVFVGRRLALSDYLLGIHSSCPCRFLFEPFPQNGKANVRRLSHNRLTCAQPLGAQVRKEKRQG